MAKARGTNGHVFLFKVLTLDGKTRTLRITAKVKRATRAVPLTLRAEHIEEALSIKGFGNTQSCMMALCAKSSKFPHPVDGYIDWQYRTAFVVSRVSKKTGFPSHCVAYEHNCKYAMHFDRFLTEIESRKVIQGLLMELKKTGPQQVLLRPPIKRKPMRYPKGRMTGERAKIASVGAHRRFAVAHPGL